MYQRKNNSLDQQKTPTKQNSLKIYLANICLVKEKHKLCIFNYCYNNILCYIKLIILPFFSKKKIKSYFS